MDSELLFEDTNLAMLGSIYEKALRLQRAEGEPQWKTIKKEPSFHICRIEKILPSTLVKRPIRYLLPSETPT